MKRTSTGPAAQAGSNASADRANSRSLDARFCRVFEEITARLLTSPTTDVDALLQEHPEHAERLRELLPSIRAMAEMGHASGSRSPESRGALAGDPLAGHSQDQTSPTDGTLGDFRLLREIGRGGMGIVYEAEQISLARRVALKVLPFASVLDERQRARFKNEALAAALLKHPNIVTVYSVGCERGVHYYAMELVEGQSLAEVITELRKRDERPKRERVNKTPLPRKGGAGGGSSDPASESTAYCPPPTAHCPPPTAYRPPPTAYSKNTLRAGVLSTIQSTSSPAYFRTVAELGIQAAEALEYAHSSGVIHRDIKPANLIVDTQGKLSITDFGLARIGDATANLTITGDLLGTLRYMSPEQALGKPTEVDHRTDVYSLGITLYELLTLQPAFAYDDRQQLLKQIADDEPQRPSQLNARIPQDLETIILKAIAKDSGERYRSAHELSTDLRRFLEHKPIAARRPSYVQQVAKWSRRHRAVVATASLVALCGLLIGAGLLWKERTRTLAALQSANYEREIAQKERDRAEAAKRLAEEEAAISKAVSDFLQHDLLAQADPEQNARHKKVTVEELLAWATLRIVGKFEKQPRVEAAIRETIGNTYRSLGNYPAAQRQLERALEIRRKVLGNEHAETLNAMSNLALLYQDQGQFDKAEPLDVQALELSRRVLGEEHEDTLTSMNNLAALYATQGQYARAAPLLAEALEIMRRLHGEEYTDTLSIARNLVQVYASLGQFDKAEALAVKTLEITRRVLSDEHPDTLISMNNLGALYKDQRQFAKAEPLFLKALEVRRRVLSGDHPATLASMNNLASLYYDQRQYDKAEPLFVKALDGLRRVEGEDHPHTVTVMDSLANVYSAQGQFAKAESLHREALEKSRKTRGKESSAPSGTSLPKRLSGKGS